MQPSFRQGAPHYPLGEPAAKIPPFGAGQAVVLLSAQASRRFGDCGAKDAARPRARSFLPSPGPSSVPKSTSTAHRRMCCSLVHIPRQVACNFLCAAPGKQQPYVSATSVSPNCTAFTKRLGALCRQGVNQPSFKNSTRTICSPMGPSAVFASSRCTGLTPGPRSS